MNPSLRESLKRLTESIQITPDVQVYFDQSNNPTSDIEAAFGLRVAMYF